MARMHDPNSIRDALKILNATKLDDATNNAILNGQTGASWLVRGRNSSGMLGLMPDGRCSYFSKSGNGLEVSKIFQDITKSKILSFEDYGSEHQIFYATTAVQSDGSKERRGYVILSYSRLSTMEGFIFNLIPEAAADAAGITNAWRR